jgi:hypothetical protein
MDFLAFSGIVVSGFVGCTEFGAFLMVYPVIALLPDITRIEIQQKLSRRRDLVLSLPSALTPLLLVGDALRLTEDNWANRGDWAAIFCFSVALAVTFWWHNPTTKTIASWTALPTDWKKIQTYWHLAQAARGSLQFLGFAFFCFSVATRI